MQDRVATICASNIVIFPTGTYHIPLVLLLENNTERLSLEQLFLQKALRVV